MTTHCGFRHAAWLAVLPAWLSIAAPAAHGACTLRPVAIEPVAAEPTDTYVGSTGTLELRFHNDKTTGPVDAFPEPPLTVRRLTDAAECSISDGGIWVRRHVYVSDDGNVLVTHEYSGSNDELVFYDTSTCGRKAHIDVSNATWTIRGSSVRVAWPKAGRRPSTITLGATCLPVGATGSPGKR